MTVLLGGDPEVFVANNRTVVPSCGLFGGTKSKGIPFGDPAFDFSYHEDNVTLEVNFKPATDHQDFESRIELLYGSLRSEVMGKEGGLNLTTYSAWEFTPNVMKRTPGAMVFGCDPDFCAYDKFPTQPRPSPKLGASLVRYAGGHLHLSYDNPHKVPAYAVAMLMDAFVQLPSLWADNQEQRRKVYGLAGLYRPKSYGLEYRSMGNWWLTAGYGVRVNMARACFILGDAIENHAQELSQLFKVLPLAEIQLTINEHDRALGKIDNLYTRVLNTWKNSSLGSLYPRIGFSSW